jgi:long-subunit acyl-CoA synthetase (AMP-forming)
MHLSYDRGERVPLSAETIGSRLRAVTARFPDVYGEFSREVERTARALVALGVQVGDRVAVREDDLVAAFGAVRAGAIVVFATDHRRAGVTVELGDGVAHVRGETVRDHLDAAEHVSPVELLTRELHFHADDAAVIRRGALYSHRALVNRARVLHVFTDHGLFGRVGANMEVKIVDPATSETVPRGVAGELWTRGYHVMLGYWNDPVATRAAIDEDAWLHTGEVAVMDSAGYVSPVALSRAA